MPTVRGYMAIEGLVNSVSRGAKVSRIDSEHTFHVITVVPIVE
jgi:hypothetical protein